MWLFRMPSEEFKRLLLRIPEQMMEQSVHRRRLFPLLFRSRSTPDRHQSQRRRSKHVTRPVFSFSFLNYWQVTLTWSPYGDASLIRSFTYWWHVHHLRYLGRVYITSRRRWRVQYPENETKGPRAGWRTKPDTLSLICSSGSFSKCGSAPLQ